MGADAAFQGCGEVAGIQIWRIEKLKVAHISKPDYGSFYSGDAYIVLHTKIKPASSTREWDIYFWLGESCSQDEQGIAAYKTVELDDHLGGTPVQHREVQHHESPMFMSVFKQSGGVKYMEGGIDSGFTHVGPKEYKPKLLHVKGSRNVRVTQVALSCSSLNHGDVFVLDNGLTLYQWNGKEANKYEKSKALDVTINIKDTERGGKPEIVLLDDGRGDDRDFDFWSLLGGKGTIKTAKEGGDDDAVPKKKAPILYRVSDASGSLEVVEVSKKPKHSDLDGNDCFILDIDSELYVWVGKKSTSDEKKGAMKNATAFLAKQGRPDWTPVTRVSQDNEPPAFKAIFASWPAAAPVSASNIAQRKEMKAASGKAMHGMKAPEDVCVDEGDGTMEIWRVENFQKVPVHKNDYGKFYSGDSYVMLYTYTKGTREEYIIYFWQGRHSSQDEKGASAILSKDLDDSMGGKPVQVRVVQNKEPKHLLTVFKGKFTCFMGGKGSGFKNSKEKDDEYDENAAALFQVKGAEPLSTKAIQVAFGAENLNSGDAFVVQTKSKFHVWFGAGSTKDEQAQAKTVAQRFAGKRPVVEHHEGKESADFWSDLGGQKEYVTTPLLLAGDIEPRLFQCSNQTGTFEVDEIYNFAQEDLIDEDVMLLDAYHVVFVWVGTSSNETEKKLSMETAQDYVTNATDGRDKDTTIIKINASNEPADFKAYFAGWDNKKAAGFKDPFEAKMKALNQSGGAVQSGETINFTGGSLTYDQLKKRAGGPEIIGIDTDKREQYLGDEEFKKLFKMDKAAFSRQPSWKQAGVKKGLSLF